MKKHPFLKYSAFAGPLSLLLYIPILYNEFTGKLFASPSFVGIAISAIAFILTILFALGFITLGKYTKNSLLIITSIALVLIEIFDDVLSLLGTYNPVIENYYESVYVVALFIIIAGVISLFHGVGVLKLENKIGKIAKRTGQIEIVFAILLITFFLSPLALLLIIPLYFLSAKLLYRASEISLP